LLFATAGLGLFVLSAWRGSKYNATTWWYVPVYLGLTTAACALLTALRFSRRAATWALAGRSDRDLMEELYLSSLSRPPTPGEMEKGLEYIRTGQSRAARAQDLLWALLNSKAFLYNY